jgi:hypothetical protein
VSERPAHDPRSSLGWAVVLLYMGGVFGILSAVVSATKVEAPNSIKFVLATISAVLAVLCFGVGIFIDVQRP